MPAGVPALWEDAVTAKPYEGTEVSVGKSQGQIDDMLSRRGITDIRWTTTTALKVLEFHHALWGSPLDPPQWTKDGRMCSQHGVVHRSGYGHKLRSLRAVLGVRIVVAWTDEEKEQRRLMRLLFWMLKSKFEIVDAGLAVFEEEFMPHLTLGQGRRMWDAFRPELERRIEEGMDLSAGIGEDALRALPPGEPPRDVLRRVAHITAKELP